MKTIMDAVNERRGRRLRAESHKFVGYIGSGLHIRQSATSDLDPLFTKEQINTTIEDLSKFGMADADGWYTNYGEKPDCDGLVDVIRFLSNSKSGRVYRPGKHSWDLGFDNSITKWRPAKQEEMQNPTVESSKWQLSAERTLKSLGYTDDGGELWKPPLVEPPIFTQAMADAGDEPPVGCKLDVSFHHGNTFSNCTLTYMGDQVGCYKDTDGKEFTFATVCTELRPIDTRTDEEKAIDETAAFLSDNDGQSAKAKAAAIAAIFERHGVKWELK